MSEWESVYHIITHLSRNLNNALCKKYILHTVAYFRLFWINAIKVHSQGLKNSKTVEEKYVKIFTQSSYVIVNKVVQTKLHKFSQSHILTIKYKLSEINLHQTWLSVFQTVEYLKVILDINLTWSSSLDLASNDDEAPYCTWTGTKTLCRYMDIHGRRQTSTGVVCDQNSTSYSRQPTGELSAAGIIRSPSTPAYEVSLSFPSLYISPMSEARRVAYRLHKHGEMKEGILEAGHLEIVK